MERMLATQVVLWETRNMESNAMLAEIWRIKDECGREPDAAGVQHSSGSDKLSFRDLLNQERRFISLLAEPSAPRS
jgi:hypothetical protein